MCTQPIATHHNSALPKNVVFVIQFDEFESASTSILFPDSLLDQWVLCVYTYSAIAQHTNSNIIYSYVLGAREC